ncbi:hypothetical protein ACWF94_17020 [Streptomyces sp. NPDC055078]
MSRPSRKKEDEVRRLLAARHTPVPADLAARAVARGARVLRRHRAVRRVAWALLLAAAIAFAVWAAAVEPWGVRPADTTPPLEGW